MAVFDQGDVVRVPFPYTDTTVREHRPALVISTDGIEDNHGLLWLSMITSSRNRGWRGDVSVRDLRRARLPAASIVRTAKIATIDARSATKLGSLRRANLEDVLDRIRTELGFS